MKSCLPLNHCRYIFAVIQAIDLKNQELVNSGKPPTIKEVNVSISNPSVTIEHSNTTEAFEIGFYAHALLTNTTF